MQANPVREGRASPGAFGHSLSSVEAEASESQRGRGKTQERVRCSAKPRSYHSSARRVATLRELVRLGDSGRGSTPFRDL